jgi:hypothetical protein
MNQKFFEKKYISKSNTVNNMKLMILEKKQGNSHMFLQPTCRECLLDESPPAGPPHHGQLGISLTFPPFMSGVEIWSPTGAAHVSFTDRNCMIFFS